MGRGGFREGGSHVPGSGEARRNHASKERERQKGVRHENPPDPTPLPEQARGTESQNEMWLADMDTIGTPLLDLHGETVEGVKPLIEAFLKLHLARGDRHVKIMTGKGEGRLFGAVQGLLRQIKSVETFQPSRQVQHAGAAFILKLRGKKA